MDQVAPEKARSHVLPVVVLLGVSFFVYAGCLGHTFLLNWDDIFYVVENEAIRGITWGHLKDAFTQFYVGNYAPIHIISYMFDYSLWGLRPGGYIFINILLHALNGILFYFLFHRLNRLRALGLLASFIFLVHPIQVESVAWISQRKTLLSMFFFLAALHFYIRYRQPERGKGGLFYTASLTAFTLALLSKLAALILPVVLFLYDVCYPGRQNRWEKYGDKIPYVLIAVATSLIGLKSQAPELGGGRTPYLGGSPLTTLFTMMTVFTRYLVLLVWPVNLSALYVPPIKPAFDAMVAFSFILFTLLIGTGVYLFFRNRHLFFWLSFFLIGFLPVAQFEPLVTFMNDRYLYFPLLGAAAFVTLGAHRIINNLNGLRRKALTAVFCLLLIPLPLLSWQRTSVWQNDVTLWTDTTRKTPECPDGWFALGRSYEDVGREREAHYAYMQALSLDPEYSQALVNIGGFYGLLIYRPLLQRFVTEHPYDFTGLMHLGTNYYLTGEFKNAEASYRKALAVRPRSGQALFSLGNVHLGMKQYSTAKEYYQKAANAGGSNANLEYNLARTEALSGNRQEALERLDAALRIGYKDFRTITKDASLDALRGDQDFKDLMKKYFGKHTSNPL